MERYSSLNGSVGKDDRRHGNWGTGKHLATVAAPPPAATRAAADVTDHDLVAATRAGDDRAFERLYQRYHRRIASYIYGMVNDYGRAEDIAQDVFMSALRRMRETDRPIAFKPWIYEIAKNACIDQFRRSRRAEEVSYDADEGLGAADYGRLVQTGPTPDLAVDQKLAIDHLRGAFGGLSETHHEILVMRELEGLSYREIGEKLGMSRPSVESTLFRARRRLTEEYEELVTGERCLKVQTIIGTACEGALGARDQRKLARHISYCQPCRRHARMAGIDVVEACATLKRAKIAAMLPLPAFLKKRWGGGDDVTAVAAQGTNLVHMGAAVSQYVEPSIAGWTKAAAAAVTVAVASLGAGAATDKVDLGLNDAPRAPSIAKPVAGGSDAAASSRATRGPVGSVTSSISLPTQVAKPKKAGTTTAAAPTEGSGKLVEQPSVSEPPAPPRNADPVTTLLGSDPAAGAGGSTGGSSSSGDGDKAPDVGATLGGAGAEVPQLPPVAGGESQTGMSEQAAGAAQEVGKAVNEILGGG